MRGGDTIKCLYCSTRIEIGSHNCPRCGAAQPPLAPHFARIEDRYLWLRSRYHAGQLDSAAYRAALKKLTVRDENGCYWTLSPQGEWYTYRGKEWVRQDPPPLYPSMPAVQAAPAPSPRSMIFRERLTKIPVRCRATARWIFPGQVPMIPVSGQKCSANRGCPALRGRPTSIVERSTGIFRSTSTFTSTRSRVSRVPAPHGERPHSPW